MWQEALNYLLQAGSVEIIGLISGILYVILAARANIWCWPVGLVNVIAILYSCYIGQLYAETFTQIIYLILTLYGWYQWQYGNVKDNLPITLTSLKTALLLITFVAIGTPLMGYILETYFANADVPYADSLTTMTSFAATWMVARKKLENWIIWIMVDWWYLDLFYYKQYYLYVVLFGIYIIVAVWGFLSWRKQYQTQTLS